MNSKHFSKFTSGSFLCSVKITEYPLHSSSVLEINTDWNYRTLYQYINMHIFYKSVINTCSLSITYCITYLLFQLLVHTNTYTYVIYICLKLLGV